MVEYLIKIFSKKLFCTKTCWFQDFKKKIFKRVKRKEMKRERQEREREGGCVKSERVAAPFLGISEF